MKTGFYNLEQGLKMRMPQTPTTTHGREQNLKNLEKE